MRQDGTKKTTIVDISRAAGLSLSTVSEILNNKTKNTYRKSTKERVLRIAAELNYQPNFAAQTLRTQKTLSIGLIVPMLYMELDEIEEACSSRGYIVNLLVTHNNTDRQKNCITEIKRRNLDGALVIWPLKNCPALIELTQNSYPCVICDVVNNYANSDTFLTDLDGSIVMAMDYLKEFGHSRIALFSNETISEHSRIRKKTWKRELLKLGYTSSNNWFFPLESMTYPTEASIYDTSYRAAKYFLNTYSKNDSERPTAILAITDRVAIGIIRAFLEEEWSIPNDISVISAEAIDEGRFQHLSITSVKVHNEECHLNAMQYLIRKLEHKTDLANTPTKHTYDIELIKGQTVAPIAPFHLKS
jgi:DNA-binding LacI/PurR family transcriptional regulator